MLRTSRHLFFSALLLVACGDDDTKTGTDTNQGETIAPDTQVQPDTEVTPDTQTPPDTEVTPDTQTPPDTEVSPEVSNECDPGEAGASDFGAPCTRDCECRTDVGGYCYDGPFLAGFHFCSRDGGLAGVLNSETYPTLVYNSDCWDFPRAQWTTPMTKACETDAQCKAVSTAYTRCGTEGLSWPASGFGTQCPNLHSSGSTTLSGKKICIIESLPPFDRRP